MPASLLGALLKKFWPGLYTPPGGEEKLAIAWPDWEAAPCVGFENCADAVIKKFWVRHISRVSFIVDDPTVLTPDNDNCFMHDCSAFIVWRRMRTCSGRRTGICL